MKKAGSTDINLFAGAGGMAIGLRNAGFRPKLFYETDPFAWRTLTRNGLARSAPPQWSEHQGDVRRVDWHDLQTPVRLLAAGVPCQPFSFAGKHLADRDGRNLFPELLRAVHVLRPAAVLVENVHGLLRKNFRAYFEYMIRALRTPSLHPKSRERWQEHDRRLFEHESSRGFTPEYNVVSMALNAADLGVPQVRRRVFVVATDSNLPAFVFPPSSHSRNALIRSQLVGDYWERRKLKKARGLKSRFPKVREDDGLAPWVTVRDAISGLPEPATSEECAVGNHWIIRGARRYPGHSGSRMDWPSKTIKAGVHGVPGGENTVLGNSGKIRYYTLREAACVQSFPRDYVFEGSRARVTRQIGNAVPPMLAEAVARAIRKQSL